MDMPNDYKPKTFWQRPEGTVIDWNTFYYNDTCGYICCI